MKAVILAGGEGTRLRPLTSNQPKPMIPIANVPMMEHIIGLLARCGVDDIVVTVAFLADQIRNYFGDGSEYGVRIRYAVEESPLGTAGSVGNARDLLDEPFLVVAGDALTDVDLAAVVAAHEKQDAFATIALKRVENPTEFGIVITGEDGTIERFLEKPTWGQVFSDTINTNIYVLEPDVFDLIPADTQVDFSGDVFPRVLEHGKRIYGHVIEGYWEDVGTIEAYRQAHQDVLDGRVEIDIGGFEVREGIWVGEGTELSPDAVIDGPAIIGTHTRIGADAHLGPYTVLGDDVVVQPGTTIERSVVHDHAYLGEMVTLRGAIVGRSADLRAGVHAEPGVVVGDDCFVGERAVLQSDVRVYPNKTVEPGASVATSIVFESRGIRSLFGHRGVRGLANVDVSAESVVRLAMAYGSTLKKGAIVTTSRDTSRTARALKRAVIAGLNLTGINVMDLELAPVPLTRFQVRSERAQGGIAVRLAADDPDTIELRFFDSNGGDLAEAAQRKVERLLGRGDFRRAFAGDVGDIWFPPRAIEYYTAALESSVSSDRITAGEFKVVLDYSYGSVSQIMPSVLAKLGADVLTVNPFSATEPAASAAHDVAERAERIGDLVRGSGSDLGAVLSRDGEFATFIDDRGRVVTDEQMLLALVALVAGQIQGARFALPVSTTAHAAAIAARHGATVIDTKLALSSILEVARQRGVTLASDGHGFAWPGFLGAFDAVATLVHLLDLLAVAQAPLSEIVDELPSPHVVHETVDTPWERKGGVMRAMMRAAQGGRTVLVDGVKVFSDDGWQLVVPDADLPLTHVWAEGPTLEDARRRAAIWIGRVAEGLSPGSDDAIS